jgi:glycosyltransferase involved in cell wall biosynthesis
MKRIICTVTNDLSFDQRMIRICTTLAAHGYDVLLVGRQLPSSMPLQKQSFGQKRLRLLFRKGKIFYLEYNLRLLFFLLFSRFEIVCSVDLDTLLPGFFAARLRGKICVYDAHEYFTEVPEVVDRRFVKKTWELLASLLIPRMKYACTVCESLAQVFMKKYATSFTVIRNLPYEGSNLLSFPPGNFPPEKWILIYQGVLNEGRGLEEMIEAMRFLEGCELWLVGEGDLSNYLRALVDRLALSERIRFWGRVAPVDLPALTAQAHIGLNLLKDKGLNYYFSLANKALDYIQAGIPSINMDFPEYRRLNEEREVFLLVQDLQTTTIVAALNRLQADASFYKWLRQNCLLARKELIWEKEENKLLDFYGTLDR